VTAAAGASLVFLGPVALRGFREGLHLNQAALQGRISPKLLEELKAAAAVVADNPRTNFEVGENLRRLSFAGEAEWEAQAREAIAWLEKAQANNAHDPMVHVSLGLCWHWLAEPVKARREFEKAMDIGPRNVAVANHYAWNLLQQGRVSAARAIFEESLTWNSWDNWFARRHLDDILKGRWKEDPKAR